MPRHITPYTTLENLKREAKRWLKALRANVADARSRLTRALPNAPPEPTLRDVQRALAVEHGLPGWTALTQQLAAYAPLQPYERVAHSLVAAYNTADAAALRMVWEYFGHRRALDAMRRYVRLDLGKTETPAAADDDQITLDEARTLVARAQGFASWGALIEDVASLPTGKATIAAKHVELFSLDASGARHTVGRSRDWEEIIALMHERGSASLHANGQMTDTLLDRLTRVNQHIEALDLEGSKALTDDGMRYLSRLPRLRHLNLMGCGITDRGLDVLRRLPALESIVLAWTPITDLGATGLAACDSLERVDLSGTRTGDGALAALRDKPRLHDFRSGNGVTDAGLALLHGFPVFKMWRGGDRRMELLSAHAEPNYLMLRGRFTDAGCAQLAGLEGLFALNLDDSVLALTGEALAPLVDLPHLEWLAFDAKDDSMSQLAALPHLRFLLCQDTTAGDEGFAALSRSRSIEYIWGRRCYNLRSSGFAALAQMPALAHLSVSCKNVDDAGLSVLPRFPALRELMPIDVPDDGYRHIARCEQLESLVLMYCRDTTDVATEHIARLQRLKKYFASYTRITDRTPELLSAMASLEEITLDSCAGVTNAGVSALARLPALRILRIGGMPRVSADVLNAFPGGVRTELTL